VHEGVYHSTNPLRQRDPCEEGVSSVRCAHTAGPLASIEREHVSAELSVPERGIETSLQIECLLFERSCFSAELEAPCNLGRRAFRSVDVALLLDDRHGTMHKRPILVEHGIATVLPAVVHQPLCGVRSVLDEAV